MNTLLPLILKLTAMQFSPHYSFFTTPSTANQTTAYTI